ncbi:MAG: hypothetical protein ABIH37_05270 [archaeon]
MAYNVYLKIFTFIIILLAISFIPIFVKFSIAESVVKEDLEQRSFFQADYELSNFYESVQNKELQEGTPPYLLAPILNVLLLIIYPILIFAILLTIIKISKKKRDNPRRLFENYN